MVSPLHDRGGRGSKAVVLHTMTRRIKRGKRRKIDRRLPESIIELLFYFVKGENSNAPCPPLVADTSPARGKGKES